MIYLDHAAAAPVNPRALEKALPFLSGFPGNPSSAHTPGREAAMAIIAAREQCAEALVCLPEEIIFTSGGTESDNLAVFSALKNTSRRRIVTTKIEHHGVLNPCREAAKYGFELYELSPGKDGVVSADEAAEVIDENTAFVSVMTVNNEIGTIQPIEEIGELCRKAGAVFHTDAAAAVGNIPINLRELPVDMLSLSGEKFGGFPGSGLLFVRKGIAVFPMILGGGQEKGLRSGTENTPGIAALGAAIEDACRSIPEKRQKLSPLRDMMIEKLEKIPSSQLNGSCEKRICSNVNFSFEGIEGETLALNLDICGVCASAASACLNGKQRFSHVLAAMGCGENQGSLRLTLGMENTEEEIRTACEIIGGCVKRLRESL